MTKLGSKLPKGPENGLDGISETLITEPARRHVIVAVVDCGRTTVDHENDTVIPTARIVAVEPLDGTDADVARRLLDRANEQRTGRTVLPLDLEDQMRDAVNVDPGTGEVL